MRTWTSVWCAGAVLVSAACYTYRPATLETVPEGTRIRTLITTEAQQRLWQAARLDVREVEGEIVERNGDVVFVDVRAAGGIGRPALYQRVDLAPQDVLRVDYRALDKGVTAAFIGGLAAAATVITVAVLGEQNPGQLPPNGNPPPEQRVRFRVGVPLLTW